MNRPYNYAEDCEPRFRKDIFERKEYDFGIPNKNNMVVIDIGAHVGLFAEYIAPRSKTIYCIEPCKGNYARLTERVNRLHLPVKTFPHAIGAKTEFRRLYSSGKDGDFSLIYETPEAEDVVAVSLDDFFYTNNITHADLVKLDTEGAEQEIIMSEGFAKVAHLIDAIVGEVHVQTNLNEINKRLTDLGFVIGYINNLFSAKR